MSAAALRRLLETVSDGDGAALKKAGQALVKCLPKGQRKLLSAWVRDVSRWAVLPASERKRLVAQGLKHCVVVVAAMPVAEAATPSEVEEPVATSVTTPLGQPLVGLPGVGPVTAERLRERGLATVGDVLFFLPRRWEDLRQVVPIRALEVGRAQMTRGQVAKVRVIPAFRRRFLEVVFRDDDGDELSGRWFQYRGRMQDRFPVGARFLISGVPKEYKGKLQIVHPETLSDDGDHAGLVRVRYPEVEGVPGRLIERLCHAVAETMAGEVLDGIPAEIARRQDLVGQADALRALHLPSMTLTAADIDALNAGLAPAQRRLVFDEFFFLQLGLAQRRGLLRRQPGLALAPAGGAEKALARFFAVLPFSPTGAQSKAIAAIADDLAEPHPMHRLLQGDVGSGKTVVAWAAVELACAAGYQAAIMAPTELLAEQHARTLEPWAGRRSLALLTASTPAKERAQTVERLANGKLDVVVGTHALLAEAVTFSHLGLVVIDEQHRFGVAQRALLREKGGGFSDDGKRAAPHLLVMTATPIPRTLALTAYGDLDLTLLDEMPPGRLPAETEVWSGKTARKKALTAVTQALAEGRQGYWVCPLVEESTKIELADVTEAAAFLRAELPDVRIGLVHGRLSAVEREAVMRAFRSGEVRLLVATTVIEVGVDVPAASLMVIEGAERFGLAQLHQLRGRIGRGGGRSRCLLLAGSKAGDAGDRLTVMAETGDGFVVAEADLRIRGPGELFGTRQAGLPKLRYADLIRDAELLRQARSEAFELLASDPQLVAHAETRAVLEARWSEARLFGEEAG